MKKITFTMLAVVAVAVMPIVSVNAEEKVDHYEGKEINTVAQAKTVLVETSQKMADVLDDEQLDIAKMEQVHETSYTTEDAVAYLDKETKANLKILAEKLEEVHLASEDHKADLLRRNYVAYQAELAQYLAK